MALQEDVRNLASIPAFRDLDVDALRIIAFSGETRILRAGDVLFRRNDPSDGGFVVLSGAIAMDTGRGPASIVRAPALIGDTALLAETIRPATALAREPSSVLKISRAMFHRVLSEHPESADRLRRTFATRLAAVQHDLDEIGRSVFK
jgi:CRP-like cAMP-binding protein